MPGKYENAFPTGTKIGSIEVIASQSDGQRMIRQNGQDRVLRLDAMYTLARAESLKIREDASLPNDYALQKRIKEQAAGYGMRPFGEAAFLLRMQENVTVETLTQLRRALTAMGHVLTPNGSWEPARANPQLASERTAQVQLDLPTAQSKPVPAKPATPIPAPTKPVPVKTWPAKPAPAKPEAPAAKPEAPAPTPPAAAPAPAQTPRPDSKSAPDISSALAGFRAAITEQEQLYQAARDLADEGLKKHRVESMARLEQILSGKQAAPLSNRADKLREVVNKLA